MTVNIPSFTGPTTVTTAPTELQGLPELDPTGTFIQAAVVPLVGYVTVSDQLYDRGGYPGVGTDQIIAQQLGSQLDAAVDTYALTQAIANAGTVTDATWSIANFFQDLASGKELLQDTAGTRLRGTHLFISADMSGFLAKQVDATTNRPVFSTQYQAQPFATWTANGDPRGDGWTGAIVQGLAAFEDVNIPVSGANTQLLVARPSEIVLMEGPAIPYAYPETEAMSLSVVVGVRKYVAVIARYPKAIAAITGAAYPTSAK